MISTREEFIEQYRRLCGHIARNFILKRKRKLEDANGHEDQGLTRRYDVDAQDLASAALYRLVRCKERYWNQPYYVKRLIVNAIINESIKQHKWFTHEFCPHETEDYFDSLPGRDGLAGEIQTAHDAESITKAFSILADSERTVLCMYFGLNNLQPKRERAIALSLGQTQFWVERRLHSGLNRLRKEFGLKSMSAFDLTSLTPTKPRTRRIPTYPGMQ